MSCPPSCHGPVPPCQGASPAAERRQQLPARPQAAAFAISCEAGDSSVRPKPAAAPDPPLWPPAWHSRSRKGCGKAEWRGRAGGWGFPSLSGGLLHPQPPLRRRPRAASGSLGNRSQAQTNSRHPATETSAPSRCRRLLHCHQNLHALLQLLCRGPQGPLPSLPPFPVLPHRPQAPAPGEGTCSPPGPQLWPHSMGWGLLLPHSAPGILRPAPREGSEGPSPLRSGVGRGWLSPGMGMGGNEARAEQGRRILGKRPDTVPVAQRRAGRSAVGQSPTDAPAASPPHVIPGTMLKNSPSSPQGVPTERHHGGVGTAGQRPQARRGTGTGTRAHRDGAVGRERGHPARGRRQGRVG